MVSHSTQMNLDSDLKNVTNMLLLLVIFTHSTRITIKKYSTASSLQKSSKILEMRIKIDGKKINGI